MPFFKKTFISDALLVRFILKAIAAYLLWFFIYDYLLLRNGFMDKFLIQHLVKSTAFVLEVFGYSVYTYADAVGIDGTHGVLIGAPCNGMELFALFAGFIIIFPGKVKDKFLFIPLGLLAIHLLNIFRLVALALVVQYKPESLEFNHKYTFTVLVYAFIFIFWMIWVNRFALKHQQNWTCIGKKYFYHSFFSAYFPDRLF